MSGPEAKQPPSHRRRAARWMLVGASLFGAVTLGVLVARPRPSAYVPGRELETSGEITRSRSRPSRGSRRIAAPGV